MSVTSAQPASPDVQRRPVSLWVWAFVCALLAAGPVLLYALLKRGGYLSPDASALSEYSGLGGAYFGSAAVCAVLLVWRSRHAVWAALILVLCIGYMLVRATWWWLQGNPGPPWAVARAVHLVVFASLLWFTIRLRRRGVLR